MEARNKMTMCRLCLFENERFFNIFEVDVWHGYVAAEVISDLFQFKVTDSDGYPHVVCETCLTKLTDFKVFKEQCQTSRVTYDNVFASEEIIVDHHIQRDEFISIKTEPIDPLEKEETSKDEFISIKTDPLDKEDPLKDEFISIKTDPLDKEDPLKDEFISIKTDPLDKEDPLKDEFISIKTDPLDKEDPLKNPVKEEINELIISEDEYGSCDTVEMESCRRTLECFHCGKEGETKEEIAQHIKETHRSLLIKHPQQKGENQKHTCDVCQKTFNYNYQLIRHQLVHSQEKRFRCIMCKKAYKCQSNLRKHMMKHHGHKPFKCTKCSFKSCHRLDLEKHVCGEKPFKCTMCSYSSKIKAYLIVHMMKHTEENFSCVLCSFRTSVRENLKMHMVTHTGEKPYR